MKLNTRKSRLALKLSNAEEKKEKLDKVLVKKQQTILHLNVENNSCVEGLSQKIESIKDKIDNVRSNGRSNDFIPTTFLGTFDKHTVLREDKECSNKIGEYIDLTIKQTHHSDNSGDIPFGRERKPHEYEKMVAEVSRLKNCHKHAEKESIIRSAEIMSGKAAKDELEKQTKKLIQGEIALEKSSLQGTISDLETNIDQLQEEITIAIKDKLPVYLKERTDKHCEAIFKADIDARIRRQKHILSKMDIAIGFLLEQASYQEVLGILMENEGSGLLELKDKVLNILKYQQEESKLDEEDKIHTEMVTELKERRTKKILQPEDTFLIAIHRILTNTDVEPNLITEDDVKIIVSNFVTKMNDLDQLVLQTESEWKRRKLYIEGLIERLQKELVIDSNNRCVLTPPEVTNKIKLAENKVREFETAVKKKLLEWEDLKRDIKSHPFLATQKKLAGTNILEKFGSSVH